MGEVSAMDSGNPCDQGAALLTTVILTHRRSVTGGLRGEIASIAIDQQ